MPQNENTESIELLQRDFAHFMELNEVKHDHIIEKLDELNEKITAKHIYCDKRFDELEKGQESLKEWRIYTIALISFLGLIVPYILPKLFP